ncbi:gp154 [Bacillus phage G]|uniref:Gp154 n=1 Tax=Bacillus phage G TaxID=2884420 RepID=G3MBM0_9CAUD|nr:gp154 [Bacillus phage G]AEO93414.1 gp154 [Bacillus phage G]
MIEKEPLCAIPRNLNEPDTIIHYPVKLNWKQISYICVGVAGAYFAFQTGLPIEYKTALMAGSVGTSLVTSLIKYEDSTIDELVIDSLHYAQKKNIYRQLEKRGAMNVKFNSYEEKITGDYAFSEF